MKRAKPAAAKPAPSHAVPASKPAPSHHQRAVLPPASAYFIEERHDRNERHVLSVIVDNEPGVLARVIGLFSGRGYNIESLTVSETDAKKHLSRITIVTSGTPMVIEQIKAQLDRLVPIHRVADLTLDGASVERELALVKVRGEGEKRVESLRIADVFRAHVVDMTSDSVVFELTGAQLANTWQEDADKLMVWYSGWYNGLAKKHFFHISRGVRLEHEVILYCKANQNIRIIDAIAVILKDERAKLGIHMK
jgi:acetolactate synthase-1/3 small subunit